MANELYIAQQHITTPYNNAYLLNCYYSNNCRPFQFTLDQIKSYIGISTSTRSNNDIITKANINILHLEIIFTPLDEA